MLLTILQLGFRNLMLHKLRSFLTMLGTILGVASVIAMLAIGEGSKQHALDQIRSLGANNVIIRSVKPEQDDAPQASSATTSTAISSARVTKVLDYGLLHSDYENLVAAIPNIEIAVPISLVRKNAQSRGRRISNARVLGTIPAYQDVKNLVVARGRFLTDTDDKTAANVAVLGAGSAERLFGFDDPLGKPVLLGTNAYRVVGVLQRQDPGNAAPAAIGLQDFNHDIYVPLNAARGRFGQVQRIVRAGSEEFERTELSEITLSLEDETFVAATASMIPSILKKSHPENNDYAVQVPLELLRQAENEKRVWNIVLGSIAGISLLVGGIGIMNIMLATVTERTREIGIRRAIGAKQRDIVIQFLAETMVISTAGGLLGIIVGIAIPFGVTAASDIQTAVKLWSVGLAFAISVATGIVFGVYPARRAALMDPIEALRHQ